MKREGRVHGCQLQAGRKVLGSGVRGKTSKPTNQSKSTAKNAGERKSFYAMSSTDPAVLQKPFGKEKQSFKEKSFDITRNSLTPDWKVYDLRGAGMNTDCGCGKAFCDNWNCSDCQGSSQEEIWEAKSPGTEMVVSIEGIMSKSKRKGGASTKAKAAAWMEQKRRSNIMVEDGEDLAWENAENIMDESEEWWGIGFDEGEVVMDDWLLITEDTGFVA